MCKGWILGLAGGILMAFLLAGCQKKQPEQVMLTVIHAWGGTEEDHVAMREIYESFQEKNPDIQLRLISIPTRDEMLRKVEDMIMVGNIPDVISFSGLGRNETYDFMVENDMALNLMPYVQQDEDFESSIAEANLEYWATDRGELFNIADVLSLSGGYWYNEDIFREAGIERIPQTWQEFMEMCETLQRWSVKEEAEIKPLRVSLEGYLYFLDHMLADNGGAAEGAIQSHWMFHEDWELETAIDRLKEIYAYSSAEDEHYSYRDETDLFNERKLAMYVNGVWGAPMISDDIHAAYALLPTESGKEMSCESACMGYVLGNSKNVEKERAAVRFLKYMLSEDVQTRILEETEQIPANPKLSLESYKDEKPRLYQAAELVLNAQRKIEVPDNLWNSSQKARFSDHILEVLSGELGYKDFIEYLE